ncbi:GerAB/ArcD/ProY family transporter [Bacillus licheniformis]|nr:GerAB/ArcD/ProY family transporter [Bacillus licheniformis]
MISLLFIEHFVAIAAFEARILAEVITFLLQQTPIWAIVMSMMWIGFYSIKDGMGSLARLFEIIFPITILSFNRGIYELWHI